MKGSLFKIIISAFIVRLVLLYIDQYWFRLPQGGVDTENFDKWAYNIYLYKPYSFLQTISNGVTLFSSYGAFIYSIVGRSPFVWGFTMILFGVGTVYNSYCITLKITKNYKIASRVGWLLTLFPNIAVLSVLVLREAPIHYFLTLSILHLTKFLVDGKKSGILFFFIYGLITSILHTAMIAIFVGFLIATIFYNNKLNLFSKFIIILATIGGLILVNITGIGLSKFGGSFENALEILESGAGAKDSGAVYPEWLLLRNGFGDLWKIPFRFIAFLFAPLFPFMVRSANHAIGLIDVAFYLILFYWILKYRKALKYVRMLGAIACIIFAITLAFSFGASNFGTNIRHRAKIFPIIAIAALISKEYKKNERKKGI